jgi:tetratricopeptide (TPR) repeat protein
MTENQTDNGSPAPEEKSDVPARHETSEADKAKARKWFDRAKHLFDTRSYDYAIKCFIDGLELWPEAIEEAHQPLRVAALARRQAGGKKPGMMDSVKHSMTGKDPVKSMLNAEWLWAHDPSNISYIEGIFKNADKARCEKVLMWIGPVLREAAEAEKKPSAKRFGLLKEVYEACGDRAQARGDLAMAVAAYEHAVEALSIQKQLSPKDLSLDNVMRDLSTKLTILKGQYQTADSFKDSVRDADEQASVHDKERMVQSDERLEALITKAEKDLADNPGIPSKVTALVDLLCRRDDETQEKKAIGLLVEHFESDGDYRFKMRADDIRMRQLARRLRAAREGGDREAVKQAKIKQLQFEIPVFNERVKKYPTDLRMKYEFGVRLFSARKYDEAIPHFQNARGDPKVRTAAMLYLGRCFYEKQYHSEAIATLEEARGGHEIPDDAVAKELLYWLGRSQADSGDTQTAKKTLGVLLQLDYNYKDVRVRLEGLRGS